MIGRPSVVAWLGPVNLAQVNGANVPDVPTINITCTGDGSPTCGAIADAWTVGGRRLPSMLSSKGFNPNSNVVLGAFSAGGSMVKRLAENAQDRDQITAMMLSDATYTTDVAPEGFVRYALDAADQASGKLMVATASSAPNKTFPSGAKTLDMIRAEVEKRRGQQFVPGALPGVTPQPLKVWRLGNVLLADYGGTVSHGEHATLLAPQIWKNVLNPWLTGQDPGRLPPTPGPGPEPGPSPPDEISRLVSLSHAAAFLTGTAVGWLGLRWARKRTS